MIIHFKGEQMVHLQPNAGYLTLGKTDTEKAGMISEFKT